MSSETTSAITDRVEPAGGRKNMFAVDEEECTGCGLCLEYCPSGAIRMQGPVAEIIQGLCTSCGSCAEECPRNAIYEYEELPAQRSGTYDPVPSMSSRPPVVVGERRPLLARQQKIAAAVLLPALSKILFRLAGRVSMRGNGRDASNAPGKACHGGHRWRGGR